MLHLYRAFKVHPGPRRGVDPPHRNLHFFPSSLGHVCTCSLNFFVSFEKEKKGEPKRFLYRESIDEFRKILPSFFPFYSSNERTTILNITICR